MSSGALTTAGETDQVVLAASAFVVEYAVGGTGGADVGTVLAAMVGVHTLIGIGEGIITALTVGVVLGVRPDLVYGAADLQTPLVLAAKPGDAVFFAAATDRREAQELLGADRPLAAAPVAREAYERPRSTIDHAGE